MKNSEFSTLTNYKLIPILKTPSKYEHQTLNINQDYYRPIPTLNNYQQNFYQIKTHVPNNKSYLYQRASNISDNNPNFQSNYSYYESKYSKKTIQPIGNYDMNITSNYATNTYKINNTNNIYTHDIKYLSKEKSNKNISNENINKNINNSYTLSQNDIKNKSNKQYFYSKISPEKSNSIKKPSMIYNIPYNINLPKNTIQPKTPFLYSQYKLNSPEKKYLKTNNKVTNNNFQKNGNKTEKNLHYKSFENINLIEQKKINYMKNNDISNIYLNNTSTKINQRKNINNQQNNFKKVIKYTSNNKNNNINTNNINNANNKNELSKSLRLSVDNKDNNINSTIVNITYINENKNYIKNIYSNTDLKPESRDEFILDNNKTIEYNNNIINNRYLYTDKRKTPNQFITIVKNNKLHNTTSPIKKFKSIEFNNSDNKKQDNYYMKEIKNIMHQNNNKNNHTLYNDINITKRIKEEKNKNKNNEEIIYTKKKKEKSKENDLDYELIYNAKITESKYAKKNDESVSPTKEKKINERNKKTNSTKNIVVKSNSGYNNINIASNINKTSSKVLSSQKKIDKPTVSSINHSNINQLTIDASSNKIKRLIKTPSISSKITINTVSNSNKSKIKTIKNNDNPFHEKEKKENEKNNRKKTHVPSKVIKKEKKVVEKPEKIYYKEKEYIKKVEGISIAGRDEKGRKKTNQDTFIIEKNINGVKGFNIFGVFDGHGEFGHFASKFVKEYIINQIKNHPEIKNEKDPKKIYTKLVSNGYKIIANIYLDADIQIQYQSFDPSRSGTTCIIIFQILENIICANTGDSRAMTVFDPSDDNLFKSKVYPLSYDCKPELPNEKKRILESGGVVEKAYYPDDEEGENNGPYRVWAKGEDYPGLAMSRSIGDMDAKQVGVIPNPQIVEYQIAPFSKYLVMGSDGLWEFISNEECMRICNGFFLRNDCFGLCRELATKATKLWETNDIIIDDITILVAFFE